MYRENGRTRDSVNKEVSSSIKVKQTKIFICEACNKEIEVAQVVFGEDVCPYCGAILSEK